MTSSTSSNAAGLAVATPQTNGCWCQFWHLRGNAYWAGHGAGNGKRLEGAEARGRPLKDSSTPHGSPAWTTRTSGWVVCFYVHLSAKRNGIGDAGRRTIVRLGLV